MKRSSKLLAGTGVILVAAGGAWMALPKRTPPQTVTAANPQIEKSPEVKGVRTNVAVVNLEAAVRGLEGERDDLKRAEGLDEFVGMVRAEDIPRVLKDLLGRLATPFGRDLSIRLLRRWVESDPQAAAAWAGQRTVGEGQEDFMGAVATAWAHRNLPEAVAWARGLAEDQRAGVFLKIAYEAVTTSPMTALELARELPATESRDELVGNITANWAAKDPQEASKWAGQIQDPAFRERVMAGIAITWGETNPTLAAAMALSSLPAGRAQNDAVIGIVQRWVQKEPATAAAWVGQFPNGELRQAATEEVVKLWVDQDAEGAGNWVRSLAAGEERNQAAAAYLQKMALSNPELGAKWAEKIEDPDLRDESLQRLVEVWKGIDAAAATGWIRQSSVPDATKERLLGVKE